MLTAIKQDALKVEDVNLDAALVAAAKDFSAWQAHDVKSNNLLLNTLVHAFGIATTFDLNTVLKTDANANGIKYQKNSTEYTLAIRLVFRGIDTARTSAYSAVLKKAVDYKQTPATLKAWIVENKGIEAVRNLGSEKAAEARKAKNAASLAKAKELIREAYTTAISYPAPNAALTDGLSGANQTFVWLARINAAGEVDILAKFVDAELLESVTRKMGEAMEEANTAVQVYASPPAPLEDEHAKAVAAAASASK